MLMHKILLCIMALLAWLNLTQVCILSCHLGMVVEVWVSHVDDKLWFLFLCNEEIWFA